MMSSKNIVSGPLVTHESSWFNRRKAFSQPSTYYLLWLESWENSGMENCSV